MTPLAIGREIFTWFHVNAADVPLNTYQKIARRLFKFTFLSIYLSNVCGIVIFDMKFSSNKMESLFIIYQFGVILAVMNASIAIFTSGAKITSIFHGLSGIYNQHANESLTTVNTKCEYLYVFYVKYIMRGYAIVVGLISGVSIILCRMNQTSFNVSCFYHPWNATYPWNQSVVFGYFGEICLSIINAEIMQTVIGQMLLLFISLCLHYRVFYEMFGNFVSAIDDPTGRPNKKEAICKLIDFHNQIKELFLTSTETYNIFFAGIIIVNILLLACGIFCLELEKQHFDFGIIALLVGTVASIINPVLYCIFGDLATRRFGEMANCLFESNWPNLPIDLQKCYILMIQNAQQPIYYHGFGTTIVNLETLSKMANKVYSYYTILRTVALK